MREWASAMHCTVAERGLWATSALTLMMPALRNEMGMWRGKLPGRVPISQ
jgi:hypothetical protein